MRIKPLQLNLDLVGRARAISQANRSVEQERLAAQKRDAEASKREADRRRKGSQSSEDERRKQEPRKEPSVWRKRAENDPADLWVFYVRAEGLDLVFYANSVTDQDHWVEVARLKSLMQGCTIRATRASRWTPIYYSSGGVPNIHPEFWVDNIYAVSEMISPYGERGLVEYYNNVWQSILPWEELPWMWARGEQKILEVERGTSSIVPITESAESSYYGPISITDITSSASQKWRFRNSEIDPNRISSVRKIPAELQIDPMEATPRVEQRMFADALLYPYTNSTPNFTPYGGPLTNNAPVHPFGFNSSMLNEDYTLDLFEKDVSDIRPWGSCCPFGLPEGLPADPYSGERLWRRRTISLNIFYHSPSNDEKRGYFYLSPLGTSGGSPAFSPITRVPSSKKDEALDVDVEYPYGIPSSVGGLMLSSPSLDAASSTIINSSRRQAFSSGKIRLDGLNSPPRIVDTSFGLPDSVFRGIDRSCVIVWDRSLVSRDSVSDKVIDAISDIFGGATGSIGYRIGMDDWDWASGEYMPLFIAYL